MANNFRRTGTIYVSKAGNDANTGLTMDEPKATFSAALGALTANNQSIVIGTGMYEELISRSLSFTGITINADGYVKFRGPSAGNFTITGTGGYSFNRIVFENYNSVGIMGTAIQTMNECEFYSAHFNVGTSGTNNALCTRCKFIDSNITSTTTTSNGIRIDFCIVANGTATLLGATNSYFNTGSSYRMKTPSSTSGFAYNNVMGNVWISSTSYTDLAAQIAAQPTYNTNSFNGSPKFNNATKYDFTIHDDSPHLGAASDGASNIGGTNFAIASDMAVGTEWTIAGGALVSQSGGTDDLILSGSDWILATNKTVGQITSAPILISLNPVQAGVVFYNGLRLYNKTAPGGGGSATNNNVPDTQVYVGNHSSGGGSPDRLVYEMRWTDSDVRPSTNGYDYPNGATGIISTGAWTKFEWNTAPYFDNNGKGNGEPDHSSVVTFLPNFTYVQMRITLRNDYL